MHVVRLIPAFPVFFSLIPIAQAAPDNPPTPEDLQIMLHDLKAEQAALAAKIEGVEALLTGAKTQTATTDETAAPATIANISAPTATASLASASSSDPTRLDVSGDLQLRYEGNFSDNDAPSRNRAVMRARLRADYRINTLLTVGAELDTGDPDDPNSVHVTLSDFGDDLNVNLSRLYAKFDFANGASLIGGKFVNPFMRTDLVWDGDENPQGIAATFLKPVANGVTLHAAAIYSIIDEGVGPDSDMIGGQLALGLIPHPDWKVQLALGYYDYTLDRVEGADAGDFRSNLLNGAGGYLSDFDLVDVLANVTYLGFGEKWPISFHGDYVKNTGAAVDQDAGFSTQIEVGQIRTHGDWHFVYGYSQAETDAVFAAFSHDNLSLATNYQSHLLGIDYALFDHVALNATLYHYRPLDAIHAGADDPQDWLDRLRLNMTVTF